MKKIFYLIIALGCLQCNSQKLKDMTGDYYLQNEPEVASIIRLNEDNTFEFFFSEGGMDRTGKGKWALSGDTIILNSDINNSKNFRLITSKKVPNDSITIQITDKNQMLLGDIIYQVKNAGDTIEGKTNDEGIATIKKQPVESISLWHQLWPDKVPSFFEITDKENNYFEFGIEKWIAELNFNNLKLVAKDKILTGGHPLKPDGNFTYERE